MAQVKITDLAAYADPVSTDVLPVVDVTADTTKKVSIATLLKNASLGTAALPGIAFDGDPNTGLYSPGADQVAVAADGFERFRVTSTGLVGIGTSSPTNTAGFLQQVQLSGSLPCFTVEQSNATYTLRKYSIGIDAVGGLGFWDNTASAYRFYINTSGQVGIGTSSPVFLTDILSGTANTGANVNNPSQLSVTGPNKSLTGGGATVFISSNSNFAIDTGGSIAFTGRNTTSSTNSVVWGVIKGAKENATSTNTAGYLAFATTNHSAGALVEAMRITSDGKVGIGTSSPNRLFESSATTVDNFARINTTGATKSGVEFANGGTVYGQLYFNNVAPYDLSLFQQYSTGSLILGTNSTERLRIASNGVVTVKNGAVAEIGTLTDAATITPDFAANCNFTVTLGGNRTIANPTSVTAGQSGSIFIVQDATGSRTASWGANWDWSSGAAPTLSTAANAVDRIDYVVRSATSIHAVWTGSYS